MKKSKLLNFAFCGAIALASLVGLAGCAEKEPPHTHEYSAPIYTVEGEGTSAKAYVHTKCNGCEDETEKLL